MVEPITSAFVLSKLVQAGSDFLTGYATERAKVAATVSQRREQVAFEREKLEVGFINQQRLLQQQSAATAEQSRQAWLRDELRDLDQQLRAVYPFADGPGSLRRALVPTAQAPLDPLLVLLAPPQSDDPGSVTWTGLRQRVLDDLMLYQNQHLIRTRLVDRPFQWPHDALYQYDLYGIPTLIVQITVDHKRLGLHLGGCHLRSDEPHDMKGVYTLRFPVKEDWSEEDVRQLNSGASAGKRFQLRVPQDEKDLLELNHELASRVVSLCVATTVDAYYLMHKYAYDEQLDKAISAAGLLADEWPTNLSIDLEMVVDPAYHLLHSALRQARKPAPEDAMIELRKACNILAGERSDLGHQPMLELIKQALNSPKTDQHHRIKLREVVTQFPADLGERNAMLDLLTAPPPKPTVKEISPAPDGTGNGVRLAVRREPIARPGGSEWSRRANRNPLDDET